MQVALEGVSAAGLQTLLQYAYTGQVGISQGNLQNVLEAAAHLQFHEVKCFRKLVFVTKMLKVTDASHLLYTVFTYNFKVTTFTHFKHLNLGAGFLC